MNNLINILSLSFLVSEIIILILKRSKSTEVKIRKDKSTMLILWIVIILAINGGIIISKIYPHESFPALEYSGIALMILGFIIRWTAIAQLGKAFTVDVSISKTHKIKDDGLYKIVRHPSYSGLVLIFFGFSLMLDSWYSILIVNVPTFIALGIRIKAEEELLAENFGEEYVNYKKRTKRLIPGIY